MRHCIGTARWRIAGGLHREAAFAMTEKTTLKSSSCFAVGMDWMAMAQRLAMRRGHSQGRHRLGIIRAKTGDCHSAGEALKAESTVAFE